MSQMRKVLAFAAVLTLTTFPGANAQEPTLDSMYAAARGKTLALAVHSIDGLEQWVQRFQTKYPNVNVKLTVINPSQLAPRVVTEQQNGIFAWDVYVGGTGNMENNVIPAGGLAPIADYLVLPSVKERSNWLPTGRDEKFVFSFTGWSERTTYANTDRLKRLGVEPITKAEQLLNPKLKGEIAIRDPGRQNNGNYTLGAMIQELNDDPKGFQIVRELLSTMNAMIVDNAQQVTNTVMTGEKAIVVGGGPDIIARCQIAGGCKNVEKLPIAGYLNYRGVVVFKNAPNPEATRFFLNWLLSKEGQDAYVQVWAQFNTTGAVSLRKDVPPHPQHADNLPTEKELVTLFQATSDRGQDLAEKVIVVRTETAAAGRR
jgi:ABC-type Fe3+ transport system substrate-binding protein